MTEGLNGLRVIEIGGVAAGMAGKVIGDLGAEVVKIEPPDGDETRRRGPFGNGSADPEASGTFLYLHTGKRSLTAELDTSGGRALLRDLAARADLLIHDLPPARMAVCGLDFAELAADNPALVMLSLTPFGLTGPYRDYASSDLTLFHAGGWGYLCPGDSTPLDLPPGKPFGQHALIQAGLHGAVVALAACRAAARTGAGDHIDLSIQEAVTFQLGRHTARFPYAGVNDTRDMPMPYEPFSFYPCKDGWIFIVCPQQEEWYRLAEIMGNPEWCRDERYSTRPGRERHAKELKARLSEWTALQDQEPLFHRLQGARVGSAPVLTYPQVERQEQLRSREYFVSHDHPRAGKLTLPGAPYLLKHPWWRERGPAPALGEANGAVDSLFVSPSAAFGGAGPPRPDTGEAPPLAGVRVLDFTWLWAGPHCTLALAMLGAEVIKVESSSHPDLTRRSHIFPPELEPGLNRCGYFNQVGQGKKSIAVNLRTSEGIELVKRIAERSDVVISNFSTGVIDRLGLGAEELLKINPNLTIATISAFGQTGPHRQYMGYGPLMPPLAGITAQTGYGDGLPRDVGTAYGDPNGGVYAAIAIAAALWSRERHGRGGQVIDVSMWEAMLCTGFEGWMNHVLGGEPHRPMGSRDPAWAPHGLYRCRGADEWVAIAVLDEEQWRALCGAMEEPAMAEDPRWRGAADRKANEDALDERIGAWCAGRERWELTRTLQAAGVPAFPSISNEELIADPHLNARGLFTDWPHPEAGARKLVGAPWHFANRPNGLGATAPLLGQHTGEVLAQVLGLTKAEIAAYRAAGAVE